MGDNCNHQKKVGKIWKKEQGTGTPGCSTHGLSLVKGDILGNDDNKDTLARSQRLQNRLCNGKLGNFVTKYKIDSIIEHKVQQKFGKEYDEYDEV